MQRSIAKEIGPRGGVSDERKSSAMAEVEIEVASAVMSVLQVDGVHAVQKRHRDQKLRSLRSNSTASPQPPDARRPMADRARVEFKGA